MMYNYIIMHVARKNHFEKFKILVNNFKILM